MKATDKGSNWGKEGAALRHLRTTPEQRTEQARNAALVRWKKHKEEAQNAKP